MQTMQANGQTSQSSALLFEKVNYKYHIPTVRAVHILSPDIRNP